MSTKTYTVTMYRVSRAESCDGSGRDTWTCQATSMSDAVAQFARSGEDRGYMSATVRAPGGKRSYSVDSFDSYFQARREAK